MKTVTRKQLIGLGASKYQADLITKSLTPVCKQGRSKVYDLFSVSDRIRMLLDNPRLKSTTRDAIQALRWELLALAEQIQDAPFGMGVLAQIEQTETLNQRAEDLFAQAKAKADRLREAKA
jgi:hypothetical protein